MNLNDLTNLVIAFSNINVTNQTILLALIIVLAVVIYKIIDDRKFKKYYDDMKSEKNKEIERLADDNRRYRDIYLRSIGFAQEQIDQMSAAKLNGE